MRPLWITAGLAQQSGANMPYASRPEQQQERRTAATGAKLVFTFNWLSLWLIKRRKWWEDTRHLFTCSMAEEGGRQALFPEWGRALLLGPDRSMLTTRLPCALWNRRTTQTRRRLFTASQLIKQVPIKLSCESRGQCFGFCCLHKISTCQCKLFLGMEENAHSTHNTLINYENTQWLTATVLTSSSELFLILSDIGFDTWQHHNVQSGFTALL